MSGRRAFSDRFVVTLAQGRFSESQSEPSITPLQCGQHCTAQLDENNGLRVEEPQGRQIQTTRDPKLPNTFFRAQS